MSSVSITPQRIRIIAGQSGFRGLRLTDGNVVQSLLRSGKRTLLQEIGCVTDVQRLLDFCRRESIEIEDIRTPYIPEWVDDPWVAYGA